MIDLLGAGPAPRLDINQLMLEGLNVQEYAVPCRTEESWEVYNFAVYCLVRAWKPKICIETGVAGGQTTCAILAALRKNDWGFLFSIDPAVLPSDWYRYEPGEKIPGFLVKRWIFLKGETKDILPRLVEFLKLCHDEVDFFFHDSAHSFENILFEFRTVQTVASPRCLFAIHDRHPPEFEEEFKLLGGDPKPRLRVFSLR